MSLLNARRTRRMLHGTHKGMITLQLALNPLPWYQEQEEVERRSHRRTTRTIRAMSYDVDDDSKDDSCSTSLPATVVQLDLPTKFVFPFCNS